MGVGKQVRPKAAVSDTLYLDARRLVLMEQSLTSASDKMRQSSRRYSTVQVPTNMYLYCGRCRF